MKEIRKEFQKVTTKAPPRAETIKELKRRKLDARIAKIESATAKTRSEAAKIEGETAKLRTETAAIDSERGWRTIRLKLQCLALMVFIAGMPAMDAAIRFAARI